ncbi:MAG TPA: hypothetical protein VLQ45_19885 [Thermoanaerobaculia bacterium]|nr:hypothetical protein [Thermoanaerobaculia bacterium]
MKISWPRVEPPRGLLTAAGFVWTALAAAAVVRFRGWTVDDFFITFRYAENLARGHGFVWNPGERVFGVSDPGLGLALALLHFVTRLPIQWIASALFGAALAGVSLLLLREGAASGRRLETLLGGSLVLTSAFLWVNHGAAAPMTLLVLLAAATLADSRPWVAGILAGSAVWIRPDAGVGVVILLLLLLLETGRLPWRTGLAAAAVIALGLLGAWLWFGSILPGTVEAKVTAARGDPYAATGAEGFWGRGTILLRRHVGPLWLLVAATGVAGLAPFLRHMRRLGRLTALYGVALAVLYPALRVPFASWYTVVPWIAVLYGLPFCVAGLAREVAASPAAGRRWGRAVAGAGFAAAAVLGIFLVQGALRSSVRVYKGFAPPERLLVYQQAAEWLALRSRPGDSVAYVEIGVLGYYSRRPLEDQMGLVTPRVVPYLARNDPAGGFLTKPTDYVIYHTRLGMAPIVRAPWFAGAYEEVARFAGGGPRNRQFLVIYRRRPGALLPAPPPLPEGDPPPEPPRRRRRHRRAG